LLDRLTLLRVDGLSAGYGGPPVISDVTFEVRECERIGVLGPNGGGKSTLFRVLLGDLTPAGGEVSGPARFGYVPQTERSRLDYPVTALDVALMGALTSRRWWLPTSRRERDRALEALERVGLREQAGAQFGELSGGQRQRVLAARALVQDAPVLLLDEPFGGVDLPSAELLTALVDELARAGRGLLIATHDVEQASSWDRVLCLNQRAVAFGPPADVLTLDVLEQTYGGAIVTLPGREVGILPPHHHEH
jgi:ABC-type Mn2+/Zn2+ transport system ATPase subunit